MKGTVFLIVFCLVLTISAEGLEGGEETSGAGEPELVDGEGDSGGSSESSSSESSSSESSEEDSSSSSESKSDESNEKTDGETDGKGEEEKERDTLKWNKRPRMTWRWANPYDELSLVVPRTENETKAAGLIPKDSCPDACSSDRPYLGKSYIKSNGNPSFVLLYDAKGHFAGVQSSITKNQKTDGYPCVSQIGTLFQEDGDRYVMTAYFFHPATICDGEHAEEEFGNALYIQNGRDPLTDIIQVKTNESEIDTEKWTLDECPGVGHIYHGSQHLDTVCEHPEPIVFIYTEGKLTGFGWTVWELYDFISHVRFDLSQTNSCT